MRRDNVYEYNHCVEETPIVKTADVIGATPLVRGKYVRVTHVRAFLSGGTFVRVCKLSGGTFVRGKICPGNICPGMWAQTQQAQTWRHDLAQTQAGST